MTNTYKIIVEKYQKFFDKNFEFEISDGWAEIVDELCFKLNELGVPAGFRFTQIKEKFGTLRLYHTGGSKELDNLIQEAEMASAKVCEECGETGDLDQSSYWLRTLCDLCSAHRNVVKGLTMAASKTHCKMCVDEINREIENANRKHAITLLSRYSQRIGEYL